MLQSQGFNNFRKSCYCLDVVSPTSCGVGLSHRTGHGMCDLEGAIFSQLLPAVLLLWQPSSKQCFAARSFHHDASAIEPVDDGTVRQNEASVVSFRCRYCVAAVGKLTNTEIKCVFKNFA